MTDYAKLIAEAERSTDSYYPMTDADLRELCGNLAAAMRELALPPGWRWMEVRREDGATANQAGGDWGAFRPDGILVDVYPTAAAAMAALEEDDNG
jgi:hypothetical protein